MKDLSKAHENNFEDFLFYDIEVFAEDAVVVFKDINGVTIRIYHNDFDGLGDFVTDKVLVGYNNYHYDDYILSAMMDKKTIEFIKEQNDAIIKGDIPTIGRKTELLTLDCFQQINVAKSSLKKVEANIGLSIDETAVDFNIKRELTPTELLNTIRYCEQDVYATIQVFKLRWFSYFVPKLMIVAMLPEEKQEIALRWNTTTITANILTNQNARKWTDWKLSPNEPKDDTQTEELLKIVPEEVLKIWDVEYKTFQNKKPKDKKCTYHGLGCVFEFSHGGLHGVNDDSRRKFENVKLLDVTSLYPNILMKINALGDKATKTYSEIVQKRVKVKHTNTILSNALKLVINSTYGLMKNEYSMLYNPMAALSVCIYGQIILYDLCQMLYNAGYTLINVNTDGVAFTGGYSMDGEYKEIQKEWEEKYGFQLELSEFRKWVQKDVNNYIAVDKNHNIKVKGGEVNHYYDPVNYVDDPLHCKAGVNWTGTNTKSIIHHCIVNKLVYDKEFVETVVENIDNPILFQYVLQCGNTYIGTVDNDGKLYQKVNRVFATKDGITLKKQKEMENKEGEKVISLQFFPNAPKNMYVYNGDLREFKDFKNIIDVDFYTELAEQKYKLWV